MSSLIIETCRDTVLNFWASLIIRKFHSTIKKSTHIRLDENGSAVTLSSRIVEVLRSGVRRYPAWHRGHLLLARYGLSASNYELVQSSILAVEALGVGKLRSVGPELAVLRGILAMRLGYPARAVELLRQSLKLGVVKITASDSEIKEELAAALVASGDKAGAIEILRAISLDKLSPQSRVARELLEASNVSS